MKKRLVDADKLMERAKMNSALVTIEHDHHDYGLTLGTLNRLVKECEITGGPADLVSKKAALDAAIEAVDEWDGGYNVDRANKIIRAMMRLPSEAPGGPDNLVNDCISRKAAIDIVRHECGEWKGLAKEIVKQFNGLPSAEIVTECNDLISRQVAIDAMTSILWHYPNECYRNLNEYEFAKGLAELGLKSVPSAQPERMRGKWIEDDDGWDGVIWRCSECDAVFTLVDGTPEENEYYFCPHCGADMRGVDDERPD